VLYIPESWHTLHSAGSHSTATELFSLPSNAVIKKFVHQLYTRLEPNYNTTEESSDAAGGTDNAAQGTADTSTTPSSLTLEQQLNFDVYT